MIYVGIDAASEKHDVFIMGPNKTRFGSSFQIKNTKQEYKKLLSKINEAKKFFKDSNVCIGVESTGVYSTTILEYTSTLDKCEVVFINPVLTNMFQLSQKVHYAKTDSIDAEGICMYLLKNYDELHTYTPISYHIKQIKSLERELSNINKLLNKNINKLTGIIHITFPEFLGIFPKLKGKLCFSLLSEYPIPSDYHGKHLSTIYKFGLEHSKGHFSEAKVEKLISNSRETIGVYNTSDRIIIKQLASLILLLMEQKQEIIIELTKLVKEHCPVLLTIPGIGSITAAAIIGEIGDITNFKNADSVLAYAGLSLRVYESGKYKANQVSITRKGSSYLRNAIFQAARQIVRRDNTFKSYFEKKLSEGKTYNCAIGHVTKKLVRVIFSILKNNKDFKSVNN